MATTTEHESGMNNNPKSFEEVVSAWKSERELLGSVAPYTARKAAQKALLFAPYLEGDIGAISTQDATMALMRLGQKKRSNGKRLSPATLRAAHLAATQALDWAVTRSLIHANPFRQVPRPKANYRQSRFLTSSQAATLTQQALENAGEAMSKGDVIHASFALAVCIALATGLRRGELFALDWDDFEADRQRISVRRAIKADGSIGLPKSTAGIRNVALGKGLSDLLCKVHAWQEKTLATREAVHSGRIICNDLGKPASLNVFGHWWRAWIAKHDHGGLRFHELRHTHATLLIAAGTDVKTVQMRMGHSSAEVTMSIYAHAIPQSDGLAAVALDAKLFG